MVCVSHLLLDYYYDDYGYDYYGGGEMDYYGGYAPPMRGRGGRGGPMPPVSILASM